VAEVFVGMNFTNLENRSTIEKTASNPFFVVGSDVMRSMVISSKGREAGGSGCRSPGGDCVAVFDC